MGDLTVFKAGDAIKSGEINTNFSTVKGAIQALEAPINTPRLADGAVTLPKLLVGGSAEDGKVLKLLGGALTGEEDLVGSSGTTYRADGNSLQLTGSTFSVKDAGIGTSKLVSGSVTVDKLAVGSVTASKLSLPLQLKGIADPSILAVENNSVGSAVSATNLTGTGMYGSSTSGKGI